MYTVDTIQNNTVYSRAVSNICIRLGPNSALNSLFLFDCIVYLNRIGMVKALYASSILNLRLICNRRKYDHVTPLLRNVLHRLPVPFRIEYKLCLLVFLSLHGAAPEYLRDCCIGTHSSASGLCLRSLERTDLQVRRMMTHFGDGAFSDAGPRCWNSLPPAIRLSDSVDSFKVQLKTYLFAKAYPV